MEVPSLEIEFHKLFCCSESLNFPHDYQLRYSYLIQNFYLEKFKKFISVHSVNIFICNKSIVWMIHVENIPYQSVLLATAKARLEYERSGHVAAAGKSETTRNRWRNATGRYERDTQTIHKANEPRSYRPVHLYSRHSGFISRESSSLSYLSLLFSCTFVIARLRWTSDLYLARPSFSAFLPQEIACRLTRSPVPSLHRISISVFHSIAPLHLCSLYVASLFFSVARRGLSSPLVHSILSPVIPSVLSLSAHEKKKTERNDRSSRWKVPPPPISPHG